MKPDFIDRLELITASLCEQFLNFLLHCFELMLFRRLLNKPERILVYKLGNIGDTVCAVPALIAIRRHFPKAHVTLLTSPGQRDAPGAKELLSNAWFLNDLFVYYSDEIDTWSKKQNLLRKLKNSNFNLFIQLPDDWALFRTLFRNMIFAKMIGVKSAFGFVIRTVNIFKRAQVDWTLGQNEVLSLLNILKTNGIQYQKPEFDFPVTVEQRKKVKKILAETWKDLNPKDVLVVVNPGAKTFHKEWPPERFLAVTKFLQEKYKAKIVLIGDKHDREKTSTIAHELNPELTLVLAGKLELLETRELISRATLLLSNDTGPVHLAASLETPVVAIYSARSIYGKWFPYGSMHKILFHRHLGCDYRKTDCIRKSIEEVDKEEVIAACRELLKPYFAS